MAGAVLPGAGGSWQRRELGRETSESAPGPAGPRGRRAARRELSLTPCLGSVREVRWAWPAVSRLSGPVCWGRGARAGGPRAVTRSLSPAAAQGLCEQHGHRPWLCVMP